MLQSMKRSLTFLLYSLALLLAGCMTTSPLAPLLTLFQCQEAPLGADRIVGGVAVGYGDPDQKLVSMLKIRKSGHESICTGTLISDRVILTAAHCVDGAEPSDIVVHLTTSAGCPVNQRREMRMEVSKKVLHKDFDGTPQSLSDVALLYLNDKAPEDQERLPILEKEIKLTSDKILLIGFGITAETKKDSQVLRRINKSWREDITPRGRALIVNQTGSSGGFCRGDSGAPIIGEVWGEPYVVAVNSANVGIQPQTECQTLSIAMDATQFADWISRNKKNLESSNWITRFFSSSSVRAE